MTLLNPTPRTSPPARPRRPWRVALRLVVALVVLYFLTRGFILDGFIVRSGSMEPLFHGHPDEGDRLLILKPFYDFVAPRRFDLVVFRGPAAENHGEKGGLMVKRVVAHGGETLALRNGDLYVNGELVRKNRTEFDDLLIAVKRWRCSDEDPDFVFGRGYFVRTGGALVEDAGTLGPDDPATMVEGPDVRDDIPAAEGRPAVPGEVLVGDLRLRVRFEVLEDRGFVELRLQEEVDVFRARIGTRGAGGGVKLYHNQAANPRNQVAADDSFRGLDAGTVHELEFYNIDNRVGLLLDGRPLLGEYEYESNTLLAGGTWRNRPAFGAPGAKVAFHEVKIDRDVYWVSRGRLAAEPCAVSEGHVFVLGDNSRLSLDSRDVEIGDVPLRSIVGRPLLIFYPLGRFRAL
ncbi:MAG: signal peptidase I [Planctomycetota bacterium]